MKRYLVLLAAVAVLVLTGVVHGLRVDRWSVGKELQLAAARVDDIPTSIGDWVQGPQRTIPDANLSMAGVTSYLSTQYRHRITGEEVSVLLLCGRPGTISVHTPEVCYPGAGFQPLRNPEDVELARSQFKSTYFGSPATRERSAAIRIYWGWSPDGSAWQAPSSSLFGIFGPRTTFFHHQALYKLYVVNDVDDVQNPPQVDAAQRFLEVFLPELKKRLAPAS